MTNTKSIKQLLAERESKMYRYYKHVFEDGFEGGYPMEYDEPIINYTQQEREAGYKEGRDSGRNQVYAVARSLGYSSKKMAVLRREWDELAACTKAKGDDHA